MVLRRTIWVLEDDPALAFIYREIFGKFFDVRILSNLAEFEAARMEVIRCDHNPPALIVADLSLPDGNFLDVLYSSRSEEFSRWPVIVVSGIGDQEVLHNCFDHGVIDYLIKPFSKDELFVKIERVLRTPKGLSPWRRASLTIDPLTLSISVGKGKSVGPLTAKEFQVVALLASDPSMSLHRDEIINAIWSETKVSYNSFNVLLVKLRKKLEEVGVALKFSPPDIYSLESREEHPSK